MPSTFTDSGIELIADGEQSGLWGQTTNLNLELIDRLTSQAGTITLSGTTHTLTVSDGVLSDGQYNVLVFAGTPSGTNTVTISPNTAQRTFFVRNTTAQSVVLSQGSGTNVTVPSNTSKIVYTNGSGAGATVFDITNTVATNVTGNAGTATTLQTARTIGGVSFNGSANINLPGVNQVGNQNTTGSAASLTTARTIGGVSFNGTANINLPGVNQVGNQNTTGSAASLTTARTFTIGSTGKTFNGTANVAWSLAEIGVNNATLTLATSGIATGSQTFTANQGTNATFTVDVPATNLSVTGGTTAGPTINSSTGTNATIPTASGTASGAVTTGAQTFAGVKTFSSTISGSVDGNAGTATALQTARTIGGVSFNGTANINLPGVNQAGNQNTTGSAASLTTARTINGVSFNGTANITLPTVNTSGDQSVAGVKTFTTALAVTGTSKAAGRFYAGTTAPTNTTRLNYDGAFHATSFVGDGSSLTGIVGVPSGVIVLWSGSTASIPAGWVICDGTNSTPDLRDRFVVGAGNTYAVDATGGADSVTLTEAQMPAHTHTFSGTTNTTGAHTHTITGTNVNGTNATAPLGRGTGGGGPDVVGTSSAGSHSHTFSGTTASTGGGSSHENRPPYYALAYIMKT